MSGEARWSELIGRRVVATDDAGEVGNVKSLVLDRDASRIRRMHVAGRKRSAQLVDWDAVESVGADAVMIESAGALHEPDNEDDTAFVKGDIDIIGARVLDTQGYELGRVVDVRIDTGNGGVVEVETDGGKIPVGRLRSIGVFALVVEAESR